MAGVKKKHNSKSKKTSKVLDKKLTLSNDELLEQIISKKKNKAQTTTSVKKNSSVKKTNVNKTNKTVSKTKDDVSSDEIYEKIKQKKNIKKKDLNTKKELNKNTVSHSLEIDQKIDFENCVLEPREEKKSSSESTIRENKEETNDLIITREIRFDDLSANLKDKKTLEDLRNAIEEFDKLDADKVVLDDMSDDIELLPYIQDSNYKLKKVLTIVFSIIIIVVIFFGIFFFVKTISDNIQENKTLELEKEKKLEEQKRREEEERKKLALYNECLDRKFSNFDLTEKVVNAQNELTNYIKNNYKASVSYFDFTYGFSYDYNQDNVYYAASTIKSLAALYIYTQAAEGKISLDDTITYLSKYKVSYSAGVSKHKIGSKIKIRDLVKYSVIYSDNSAHQMLVSYIGRGKLKEFGKNLGAKNTLNGGDNFGNISSADGIIYMNAVNNFIENNGELGDELKKYFVTSQQNEISVNNLDVAHKYGLYKNYYHNMGIVYDEKPYVVSIMTLHGNKKNKEKVISDLSNKVYELHNLFKVNREEVCNLEVYANEKSTSS